MKILINESQLDKVMKSFFDKFYQDDVKNVEVDGNTIKIVLPGTKNYPKQFQLAKKIRNDLDTIFSGKNFKFEIVFEKEFFAEVEIDGDEKSGYSVHLVKTLDNGDLFELDGELKPFDSGRDIDYEFEPDYISDDDYYDENWELIEDYILDKLTDKLYKEKKTKI